MSKNPTSSSTSKEVNPKSANTHNRLPCPMNQDGHDETEGITPSSLKNPTYKEIDTESTDNSVIEKPPTTTFHLCKNLHNRTLAPHDSNTVTVSNDPTTNYINKQLIRD